MPRATDHDVLVVPDAEPRPPLDAASLLSAPHALDGAVRPPRRSVGFRGASEARRVDRLEQLLGRGGHAIDVGQRRYLADDPPRPGGTGNLVRDADRSWGTRSMQGSRWSASPPSSDQSDRIAWAPQPRNRHAGSHPSPPSASASRRIDVKGGAPRSCRAIGRPRPPHVRPGYALRSAALEPEHCASRSARDDRRNWPSLTPRSIVRGPRAERVTPTSTATSVPRHRPNPIRRETEDGARPADGAVRDDWRGYVPMAEMPRVVDPPQGYLVPRGPAGHRLVVPHIVTTH